ncbi:E3 ubiquitin/ISG15 ligase TRIM25-like [Dendropsophus ebraccatus]|uniref:E3 ubiquitin/ISG15 ligase TRIM25-like n=1 Tax=Dendropsophus ebraccatus TaxID=150705 RepID=UPI00383153A5
MLSAMAFADLKEKLECSICLNLYTDPVTLRCGHNFCRGCIDQVLNTQDGAGVYSCPECREEFQERPTLQKNITLCNVVENFLSTHSDNGFIFCTYCVDSPVPAVRSCLLCEASLCDNHLRAHSKSPEHVLTDPSTSLEKRKCSVHKKILEYYCTEDNACICVSCRLDGEHRGYRVEMLDEASEKELRNFLQNLMTKREKTEERVRSAEEQRKKAQEKATRETERVTALFIDIRRRLDDLEKRVLSEISRQERQRSLLLSDVIQKLEIKKDELSRKMRHIEELCNMADPLTVLQDPDTGDLCDSEEEGGDKDTVRHDGGDEDTGEHDGEDGDTGGHDEGDEDTGGHDGGDEDTGGHDGGDEDTGGHDGGDWGQELISHISDILFGIIIDVTTYLHDPADILLDVNTAYSHVDISNNLKSAYYIYKKRPETAERFKDYPQVMSSRGFSSGRHYWDVEINRSGWWRVGMCYPSMVRESHKSIIGDNNKSWCLYEKLGYHKSAVAHDNKYIVLPHQISSAIVRICLDYEAGQLSFYELCDPIRHLHTFTATFTEPLHAVLGVLEGSLKISGGGGAAVRCRQYRENLPRDW